MNVVVSQSMYFPWVGLLEQVRLADVFVHYNDVQFTRGFFNRVQIKAEHGIQWMTVPLRDQHRGQNIDEVRVDNRTDWRAEHRDLLARSLRQAPFFADAMSVAESVLQHSFESLAEVSRASVVALSQYFGLTDATRFVDSRSLGVDGRSSIRLLDIVHALGGSTYITGHGARNYLDHELFDRAGVSVEYMAYRCLPYPQLHGGFTPYVSALDVIANCGRAGVRQLTSTSAPWRQFVALAA